MSLEEAAAWMGSDAADLQALEADRRPTEGDELLRLAYLYMRDASSFEAVDFIADSAPAAMLRANSQGAGVQGLANAFRRCVRKDRQMTEMDTILARKRAEPHSYALPTPKSAEEARRQGMDVAKLERARLGLGASPILNMSTLLDCEGVRTDLENLPPDVSGFMLIDGSGRPFVAVRQDASSKHRELDGQLAREYAHVLFDRVDGRGTVSRRSMEGNWSELRAEAFAIEFLMPAEAVRKIPGTRAVLEERRHLQVPRARAVPTRGSDTGPSDETRNEVLDAIVDRFYVSRSMALARLDTM